MEASMPLTDYQKEFLTKLADLCDEYRAGFGYTWHDDGTHIYMDGKDVFCGFVDEGAAQTLREALKA